MNLRRLVRWFLLGESDSSLEGLACEEVLQPAEMVGESPQLLLTVALQATFYPSKSSYLPLSASFSILSFTHCPSADILYIFPSKDVLLSLSW